MAGGLDKLKENLENAVTENKQETTTVKENKIEIVGEIKGRQKPDKVKSATFYLTTKQIDGIDKACKSLYLKKSELMQMLVQNFLDNFEENK